MVVNDNDIIVPANGSPLASTLYNKYISLYYAGQSNIPSAFPMYKMHLLSLYGTLDFSNVPQIESVMTTNRDTVFKYVPYVTSLVLDGCSRLYKQDPITLLDSLDFSNLTRLTSASFNGCTNLIGTLDFTNCTELDSLDARNTSLGVILPQMSKITSLQLGSPTEIRITQPTVLGNVGTVYTMQSETNLTNVELININQQGVKGFSVFNNLFA